MPFEVPGYLAGWESPFPAHLVSDGLTYEIHIAVKSKSTQPEEKTMLHEGILARMGRLLAAIASQTIDNAENSNKVALVKQAIREIDAGADEARYALGKSRAEEFRLKRRREELDGEDRSPDRKDPSRDLRKTARTWRAPASHVRLIWNPRASRWNGRWTSSIWKSMNRPRRLQAMLGARREAEARLADLEKSIAQHAPHETGRSAPATKTANADHAMAAIARVTGVPACFALRRQGTR